jgi:hypothetical protein
MKITFLAIVYFQITSVTSLPVAEECKQNQKRRLERRVNAATGVAIAGTVIAGLAFCGNSAYQRGYLGVGSRQITSSEEIARANREQELLLQ